MLLRVLLYCVVEDVATPCDVLFTQPTRRNASLSDIEVEKKVHGK